MFCLNYNISNWGSPMYEGPPPIYPHCSKRQVPLWMYAELWDYQDYHTAINRTINWDYQDYHTAINRTINLPGLPGLPHSNQPNYQLGLPGLPHSNQPNYQLSHIYFRDRRSFPGWAAIWDSSVTLGCWILHVPWICDKTVDLLSSPNHACVTLVLRAVGVWERFTWWIWPGIFRQSWKQCKGRDGGGLTVVYTRRTSCEGLRSTHS